MNSIPEVNKLSGYLYATPSFLEGVARLVDISNSLSTYNTAVSPEEADTLALLSDSLVVGDDIREAMLEYQKLHYQALKQLIEKQKDNLVTVGK